MSKKEPSLIDLGLDAPVEKPFGKALDNYDSSKEAPLLNSSQAMLYAQAKLPKPRRINVVFWLLAIPIGFVVLMICLAFLQPPSAAGPTKAEVIQVLLDDFDGNLNLNIFGNAKTEGRHLIISLEDGQGWLRIDQDLRWSTDWTPPRRPRTADQHRDF